MIHQLLRYLPVLEEITETGTSVCEVGSGSLGATRFVDTKIVGIDSNFTDYTDTIRPSSANLIPVMADACSLPFPDSSFDMVFSCDMLEHIPPEKRSAAIAEMLRIARKKLILVFPCGNAAAGCDLFLWAICRLFGKRVPGWLAEHHSTKIPQKSEITKILNELKTPFKISGNAGIILHYLLLAAESIGPLKNKAARASAHYLRVPGSRQDFIRRLAATMLVTNNIGPRYRTVITIEKVQGCSSASI